MMSTGRVSTLSRHAAADPAPSKKGAPTQLCIYNYVYDTILQSCKYSPITNTFVEQGPPGFGTGELVCLLSASFRFCSLMGRNDIIVYIIYIYIAEKPS